MGDFRWLTVGAKEPANRPYGIEALLRDDSGNWFSLTQAHERMDETADWGECIGG